MSLILNSGLGIGGGSGSDKHNLGWYADPEALSTAHPEGTDGDYAIVGSTDTVWVWDSDSTAWVDTDTKGQVTTVNGQTGDVTVQETLVSRSNIKSINGNSLLGSGDLEIGTHYHNYHRLYISSDNQYVRVQPLHGISYYDENTGTTYSARCSELDISMVSTNGGKWHAIIENSYDSYTGRILEATGDLTNVQIGWDTGMVYNTTIFINNISIDGYVNIVVGAKGSSENVSCRVIQNLDGIFIPATLTRVTPGTATKVTFDGAGTITDASNLQESDIPSLSLTKIGDITATSTEVNKLHGVTVTSNEINYLDGVSSNIQNQLTNKVVFRQWTTTTEEPGE